MPGKFELYKDVRERYRFRLISENGELILSGDGYTQKVLALDAIVSIMRSASEAAVIDLSLPGQDEIPIDDAWMAEEDGVNSAYPKHTSGKRKQRNKKGKKRKRGKKRRK